MPSRSRVFIASIAGYPVCFEDRRNSDTGRIEVSFDDYYTREFFGIDKWEVNKKLPTRLRKYVRDYTYISMDVLLKIADDHIVYKTFSDRLHIIKAELKAAIDKKSNNCHGGDSIAMQFQRHGNKPGSQHNETQHHKVEQKMLDFMMRHIARQNKRAKQQNTAQEKRGKQAGNKIRNEMRAMRANRLSSARYVGGGKANINNTTTVKVARTLQQFWGLYGNPYGLQKISPIQYQVLADTSRNPMPALFSRPLDKNIKVLITNDESGSCGTISGATQEIALELQKICKSNAISVIYRPNVNGNIYDTELNVALSDDESAKILRDIDYILYLGDGDAYELLLQNKVSKNKWIYLDTYSHNWGKPRVRKSACTKQVIYIDRVDVSDVDDIYTSILLAKKYASAK